MLILTVASNLNFPGLKKLEASLQKFGYQYHVINAPFRFGGQSPHIYEWAKAQDPALQFLYSDAYDTVALGPMPNAQPLTVIASAAMQSPKMIISCEKACFPHPQLAEKYPPAPYDWKYINGGGWMTTCGFFCQLFESGKYEKLQNDQLWLTHEYLDSLMPNAQCHGSIELDTHCQIFQSIAFEAVDDFTYGDRLKNNHTGTEPIFIHGNGRTDMSKIYALPCLSQQPATSNQQR